MMDHIADYCILEENQLLAIKLMRTGAKKRPSYRVVVKEKQSKRDGAYLENLGTYNPTREPAEINLKMDRVRYWIAKGAQPTETVDRLIKASGKEQAAAQPQARKDFGPRSGLVSSELMKEAVEMIVKALVDDVDAVDVREIDRNGATLIEIRVAPEDMGKVIGRQGRTVRAFERWLMRLA